MALNDEVSFVMVPDPRGNQDRAANVQILNTGFAADQLSMLSGQLGHLLCSTHVPPCAVNHTADHG